MRNQAFIPESRLDRRGFLTATMYGFVALINAGLGIPALRYLFSPSNRRRQTKWIDAGDLSGVEPGSPQEVTFRRTRNDGWNMSIEEASAWVVKRPDGEITAFAPACTHLGCAYHWDGARGQFACPCHGSRFGMDGKVLAGPAPRPLDRYEVKVEGSRLWLGPVQERNRTRS